MIAYSLILIASILMFRAKEGQTWTYLVAFAWFWMGLGGWLAIAPTATMSLFKSDKITMLKIMALSSLPTAWLPCLAL